MIRFHLKRSKCNQFGNGVDVFIGRTSDDLCLVVAVLNYLAQRGNQTGAFFRFRDGSPLTKARFVLGIRRALTKTGVDCTGYSGHSFRIGAATAASQASIADSTMCRPWEDGTAQPSSDKTVPLHVKWLDSP